MYIYICKSSSPTPFSAFSHNFCEKNVHMFEHFLAFQDNKKNLTKLKKQK